MGVLLTAGINTINEVGQGTTLNNWVNDDTNPNMSYFRAHLQQVVIRHKQSGETITISPGAPEGSSWGWHFNQTAFACHCQSFIANYLPLFPGQTEYQWPSDESNLMNLEIPAAFTVAGENDQRGAIFALDGSNTVATVSPNNDGTFNWVGSLTQMNKGQTYRFINRANYTSNWSFNSTDNQDYTDPYGPCADSYTHCSTEFSSTGNCPDSDITPGCILLEYTDPDSNFNNGNSNEGTAWLELPSTSDANCTDCSGYPPDSPPYLWCSDNGYGCGNNSDGECACIDSNEGCCSEDAWEYTIYMDNEMAPIYVNLFGESGEASLTTYVRGTMNYTGTTLGGCAGCSSSGYDFGFDDERHCCQYRHGGSRNGYTLEHNNGCDEEVWPANNDGYNCHYPTLPPNSDFCGDNICYEGTSCSQIINPEDGTTQYFCMDNDVQNTSDYHLFGRIGYNPDTGDIVEIYNSQGNLNADEIDSYLNYGSLTNVCLNAPFLNNDSIQSESQIAVIENLEINNTLLNQLDLRVFDCYDTENTVSGDTLQNQGCLDPSRCNYNTEATIHQEWMCGTDFDCNGNCDKTILGATNPSYGWEIDNCGLCSDPTATGNSSTKAYSWTDECGNCIANTRRTIAYNYSGKTISHPGDTSNDGTIWDMVSWGDIDFFTGDRMCEQNSYWSTLEQSQCVGVEVQLQTGAWVNINDLPDQGMMMSLQEQGLVYPGWNPSSVEKQCMGSLDSDAAASCITGNNHQDQYTAWNVSCCDYACTENCEIIRHNPVWTSKKPNIIPETIIDGVISSTGCELDWKNITLTGGVNWENNSFDNLYGEPQGMPVREIRAVCGKPQVLPEASTTLQNIPYGKVLPTPLLDPVIHQNSVLKSVSILQQGDLDLLHDDNPNQWFFGDINNYTGTPPGHDHWKSVIPFLNSSENLYRYQITKIIDEVDGHYVDATSDGAITYHEWNSDTGEHTATEYIQNAQQGQLQLQPGKRYSVEVVYNPTLHTFYSNSANSNNPGYQYLTAFGKPNAYNEVEGGIELGVLGKLYCCTDNEPHNGMCDYPFEGDHFCNNSMSGEFAIYSRIDSCSDLPGNWIDYYTGVFGDIEGCMDPTGTNYNPQATMPEDFSECNYTQPLGVEYGSGFNNITNHDFTRSGIATDNGVVFKKQINEDNVGYVGTIEIIDYNYGDSGQVYTTTELLDSAVIEYEAENKDDPDGDYQAILKYFQLTPIQSQPEPYEEMKFLYGRAYNAMIYPVEILIQPTPNVFGDFTDSSIGCNAYMIFSVSQYKTIVGFELIINNVDDYPVAYQYTPNLLKESNIKESNWGGWVNSDTVGSHQIQGESLLPPGEVGDDNRRENFVWNHLNFLESWSGITQGEVTHARVYPRAGALVIPHNVKHLEWNMENTPNVSGAATQKYQDQRLPSGQYKISGWVKYVSGEIKYPDGSYPNTTRQLSLYTATANWPWRTADSLDLSPMLRESYEGGHTWKFFDYDFTWTDDNYICSAVSNDYAFVDDVWGEYHSWPRYCSSGAGAECTHPDITTDSRGKMRNIMAWDGSNWRACDDRRDNFRMSIRSHGSIDPDKLLTVGIYGLQLKRIKDHFDSRNPQAVQFIHKENDVISLPAGVYARDPYDTWNDQPDANFCDASRVVRLTTELDSGDLSNSSEAQYHEIDFKSIYDATKDFGIQEWDGLEVGFAGSIGDDFYSEALWDVIRLDSGEFISILGHQSELTCIEEGIDMNSSETGQPNVPDTPPVEV